MLADASDPFRLVPFMHDDDVRAIECLIEVQRRRIVGAAAKLGKCSVKIVDCELALVDQQIAEAPAILWFVHVNLMAAVQQLTDDAAKEMRVAVIPVRDQRVTKQNELHATARAPLD